MMIFISTSSSYYIYLQTGSPGYTYSSDLSLYAWTSSPRFNPSRRKFSEPTPEGLSRQTPFVREAVQRDTVPSVDETTYSQWKHNAKGEKKHHAVAPINETYQETNDFHQRKTNRK